MFVRKASKVMTLFHDYEYNNRLLSATSQICFVTLRFDLLLFRKSLNDFKAWGNAFPDQDTHIMNDRSSRQLQNGVIIVM